MPTFRVCHDDTKYRPTRWTERDRRLFGDRNEGAEVQAASREEAIKAFASANRLNPVYLTTK